MHEKTYLALACHIFFVRLTIEANSHVHSSNTNHNRQILAYDISPSIFQLASFVVGRGLLSLDKILA